MKSLKAGGIFHFNLPQLLMKASWMWHLSWQGDECLMFQVCPGNGWSSCWIPEIPAQFSRTAGGSCRNLVGRSHWSRAAVKKNIVHELFYTLHQNFYLDWEIFQVWILHAWLSCFFLLGFQWDEIYWLKWPNLLWCSTYVLFYFIKRGAGGGYDQGMDP